MLKILRRTGRVRVKWPSEWPHGGARNGYIYGYSVVINDHTSYTQDDVKVRLDKKYYEYMSSNDWHSCAKAWVTRINRIADILRICR